MMVHAMNRYWWCALERETSMKFRILKEKITPDIPVLQCGYAARTHKSVGVHDDIYASVILMQSDEKDGTAVIIALDLAYGDRSFACGIKEAISRKYGLTRDKIIVSYSHTHSSVATTGEDAERRAAHPYNMNADNFLWDREKEDADYTEDVRYYKSIRKKIMDMLEEGFKTMLEGDIHILKGKSRFGVSRRFPTEAGILWRPCFDEKRMDPDLFLLKFVDRDNNVCGLIYHYACHPTTLGSDNYLISADYPGVVRRVLEEKNPGLMAVFLQGCGADIKPCVTADGERFKSCGFEELERAGVSLANEIQGYMDKPGWRKIDTKIETGCSDVKLYTEIWNAEKWEQIMDNPDEPLYRRESAKQMVKRARANGIRNYLPYFISFLRLDGQTCMACLECEVVSDIGKEIKKLFAEDVMVMGYTNSISCYIPTRQVLEEGGYERESFIAARLAGPFVPEAEDIIVGRSALLISQKQLNL